MTREEFLKIVNKIDTYSDYPWKHELNYLRDHDAEQRETIWRLRETLEFITMNDHSLTIKQAAQCASQALAETEPRDERETNP